MVKKGLGKGLGSIISGVGFHDEKNRVVELNLSLIEPNPDQPRKNFNSEDIQELADSIKANGLIQPIIVRKIDQNYVIVAGERRWRASQIAGLEKIKAIVIEAEEKNNFILALVENVQRTDLNPLEEAKAYDYLINKFNFKQQELSDKIGKNRVTIANSLRLLNLPEEIQLGLLEGKITSGHAKVLLSISNKNEQKKIYQQIINSKISVKELAKLTSVSKEKAKPFKDKVKKQDPHLREMEEKLISLFGTKVEIKHSGNSGKIEISYYSLDDFDRLVDIFEK